MERNYWIIKAFYISSSLVKQNKILKPWPAHTDWWEPKAMVIVDKKLFPKFHKNCDRVCNGLTRTKYRCQTPGLQGKALRKTRGLIQVPHCWIKTLVPSENSCRDSSGGCPFLNSTPCSGSQGPSQISPNGRTIGMSWMKGSICQTSSWLF